MEHLSIDIFILGEDDIQLSEEQKYVEVVEDFLKKGICPQIGWVLESRDEEQIIVTGIIIGYYSSITLKTINVPPPQNQYPLKEMDISVWTKNRLILAGYTTLREISKNNKSDLLKIRLFGPKSLREISELMERKGLKFGTNV